MNKIKEFFDVLTNCPALLITVISILIFIFSWMCWGKQVACGIMAVELAAVLIGYAIHRANEKQLI